MGDLKTRRWIVTKGVLFAVIALATAALILSETPSLRIAALLALLVWASCRFYYFLDPTMRYAGLFDLLMGMKQRRERMRRDA